MKTDEIAQRVSRRLARKSPEDVQAQAVEIAIDPATVIVIGKIIISVIKMIKECRANKEVAVAVIRHPNQANRRQLRRAIRREVGWWKYWKEGENYYAALRDEALTMDRQEIEILYEEV